LLTRQKKLATGKCGAGEEAAIKLADDQAALVALLPKTPNERLVYDCQATEG
jgi:hypothetical protein